MRNKKKHQVETPRQVVDYCKSIFGNIANCKVCGKRFLDKLGYGYCSLQCYLKVHPQKTNL